METEILKIEGMSCQHCVKAVEMELAKMTLKEYQVEVGKAKVTFDEKNIDKTKITDAIEEAGYKVVQ